MSYSVILNPHPVTGPLTDTQLRASAVPMSLAALPALATGGNVIGAVTQSGAWNIGSITTLPALVAGAAIIGKVGVDQTTPGTTNGVSLAYIGSTSVASGNGVAGAGVQRVAIASDNSPIPVSGPLTDTQLRASAVPMSLAALPALATGGNVIGAVTQSGTWNIGSITTLPALVAGAAIIGKVGVDQTTPGTTNGVSLAHIGSTAVASGNGVAGAGVQRVAIASDNSAVPVSAPTLTKGTQGANGLSVQELKDAGRSTLCMTAEFTFAQVAETLLTMTLSVDGAATSTFSSRAITSGKKFRIQSIHIEVESLGSGTAPQRAYLRLRRNNAGATVAGSQLQAIWACVNNTAIVKSAAFMDYEYPDGMEMNGDGTATFGFTLETPDWVTTTATGRAKITVIGYEF